MCPSFFVLWSPQYRCFYSLIRMLAAQWSCTKGTAGRLTPRWGSFALLHANNNNNNNANFPSARLRLLHWLTDKEVHINKQKCKYMTQTYAAILIYAYRCSTVGAWLFKIVMISQLYATTELQLKTKQVLQNTSLVILIKINSTFDCYSPI